MNGTIVVHADWDAEARVWTAQSSDVPGLVTEASTIRLLMEKLPVMTLDLHAANGVDESSTPTFTLSLGSR